MPKTSSSNSIWEGLRESAEKLGERYMDALGINRKQYSKLLSEGSAVAQDLSQRYLSTPEQDGSEIAANHERRLDFLRKQSRHDYWEPEFPPERPPDERPFDELPDFPAALDQLCYYTPVVTLDTAAKHVHTVEIGGESSDATFTDTLDAGVNMCTPSSAIITLRPHNTVADPTTAGFYSGFRFNFTPPARNLPLQAGRVC